MEKTTTEKLSRVQELLAKKAEIERELDEIFAPERVVAPPPGFDLNSEITLIVETKPNGMSADEISKSISEKWKISVERKKLNMALIYLVNRKKTIARVEGQRGMYKPIVTVQGGTVNVE